MDKNIVYIGVNDHKIDLFEGQYKVPEGMSYNSYFIKDKQTAVIDSVDARFTQEWFRNIKAQTGPSCPDYLVIQHMEPDHSGSIAAFMNEFPSTSIVSSQKAFNMMKNFFGTDFQERSIVIEDGNKLPLGEHTLNFIAAPMVHWPEVMMSYEETSSTLFSADGFGKFGALDTDKGEWDDEARRYYIGIVGKYGAQVQSVLKKASSLPLSAICPLHGPVLTENLKHYISLYDTWSSYTPETSGIAVFYTSVYGDTKHAVEMFTEKLKENGCPSIVVNDLARCDMSQAVADAFRYEKIVLATTTYNGDIFPPMRQFITSLTERFFRKRTVGLIENGSWAPQAAKIMKKMLEECKDLDFANTTVTIKSAVSAESTMDINSLADELCKSYIASDNKVADKNDLTALFKIGYGLYVVTSNDGKKNNGCIVNTVTQVTNSPNRIAVCVNKANYSHDVIMKTGKMNVNCLSVEAPFKVFQHFGFQSGKNVDKFADWDYLTADNGVAFLPQFTNAFMSLKVEQYVDLDTHGMFICTVSESRVLSNKETMTYTYYQSNVKPKPEAKQKKGYVCKVCGYVYEGDELPEDFVCPLCKHPASDFEKLQ